MSGTPCKQCGGTVFWEREGERWLCLNADGSDHWDACSKRRWEQVKATGERFETSQASGYANSVHGTKYDRITAPRIVGDLYKPFVHRADCKGAPPWEECGCQK